MAGETTLPEIPSDDFARRFSMRPGQLMWFLGAGVSASAGIPTAMDMIWRFKRELFVAQRKVSADSVSDLADPSIQQLLNAHVAASESLPAPGAPDEYAALFEATFPAERDRQAFIRAMIKGAKLAYGHLALAAMLKAGHSNLVWTTNFDHLLGDACAKTFGTTLNLNIVGLDSPSLAGQQIATQSFPIEIKLHGDFRSRRLKNTSDELRHQDAQLGAQLRDSCGRYGLIVAGYSGRDDSVMDVFEAALVKADAFPGGLFWLHRGEDPPSPRVTALLAEATAAGVEAGLVRIDSFDELMVDLVRQVGTFDTTQLDALGEDRRRFSPPPTPAGSRGFPIIRLNAIEVASRPANCRKVVCTIGGLKDVREAVTAAQAPLVVTRTRLGILGFGSDDVFRNVFGPFGITDFDIASLEVRRMRYDSHERGLMREALILALSSAKGLDRVRQRNADLLAPTNPHEESWGKLAEIVGRVEGSIRDHPEIRWREGVSVRLDWADERLWLLIDPRIVFDGVTPETKAITADFARERTVKRYNREIDRLIHFWTRRLAGQGLRALKVGDGIDASFTLDRDTAFARTAQP
jgi:NAD-dependent SIR2 family protein deacetylase